MNGSVAVWCGQARERSRELIIELRMAASSRNGFPIVGNGGHAFVDSIQRFSFYLPLSPVNLIYAAMHNPTNKNGRQFQLSRAHSIGIDQIVDLNDSRTNWVNIRSWSIISSIRYWTSWEATKIGGWHDSNQESLLQRSCNKPQQNYSLRLNNQFFSPSRYSLIVDVLENN